MAQGTDLWAHSSGGDMSYVRSNGEIIPPVISKKVGTLGFNIYEGNGYGDESENYNGSLGNFFAEK